MEHRWHEALASRKRERAVGGGRRARLRTGSEKLLFILFYLKVYPTFDLMGVFFDLDRSQCCRWVHRLMPLLEDVLGRKQYLPKRRIGSPEEFRESFPGVFEVIIDGTERPIQRPGKPSTSRKHYSGKKKRHTRKTVLVADTSRKILVLGPSRRGARHDKKLADKDGMLRNIPPEVSVLADSGFQGGVHAKLCLPHKRSKNRPLDDESRDWNRLLASIRVRVEHAIGGMKRFGVASGIYRSRKPGTDDKFNLLSAGLWNYHLTF